MPPAPDIGLDAITLTPASASMLFSPEVDIFSEWLGPLQHGDLLNEHGFDLVFRPAGIPRVFIHNEMIRQIVFIVNENYFKMVYFVQVDCTPV